MYKNVYGKTPKKRDVFEGIGSVAAAAGKWQICRAG